MSGHFETLIYTDCRPGQGLRGSAGLQFQARSSDAVAAAESMVRDHLLYEPPSRWMADRRPMEDYPRSFAHLSAAGFCATAAGLYLGREVNGVREGNQLTHAIVTSDPEAYAGLRPAQLFGAAFWSDQPADTTRSEPVDVSPSGGPYSPARAKQFVLAQPDGPETLLALVSALHNAGQAGAGRVLFVAADVPAIVEWLVAGTLLVSRARALELGFKIFSNDPARSQLPIVAVHPDFAGPSARIDNQLGYVVFDLAGNQHTKVAESPAARRWVDLFLDGDPRDAVDALDVAAESDIADETAAAALGLAAILHEEPSDPEHAKTIVGWLRRGPQRLRDAYGADLADLFAEVPERWPRDVLRLLDEVGGDGLLQSGKAAEVRIALLLKDVEEAIAGGRVTADRPASLPPGEWGPDRDEQARELLREAIEAPGCPGHTIEALLRVAHRYSADLHPKALGAGARELARFLADHPDRMRPGQWPNGSEVDDLLIDELSARVRRGGPEPAAVGDDWRDWLMARSGPVPRELVVAALGAAVRHGDDRTALIHRALNAAQDPPRCADQAAALFSQSRPTLAEVIDVLELAPDGTPPIGAVFDELAKTVAGRGPVTADEIRLCMRAFRQGLVTPARILEGTLVRAEELLAVTAEMRQAPDDPTIVRALVTELGGMPSRLLTPYEERVVEALNRVPVFGAPAEKLLGAVPGLVQSLAERVTAALKTEERAAAAFTAFWLTRGKLADDKEHRPALSKALDQWLLRMPDKKVAAVGDLVTSCLNKEWAEAWEEHVDSLSGRRRRYKLSHPFGGGRS